MCGCRHWHGVAEAGTAVARMFLPAAIPTADHPRMRRPPLDSLRRLLRKDEMRSSLLETGYSQEIDSSVWKSIVGCSCI